MADRRLPRPQDSTQEYLAAMASDLDRLVGRLDALVDPGVIGHAAMTEKLDQLVDEVKGLRAELRDRAQPPEWEGGAVRLQEPSS